MNKKRIGKKKKEIEEIKIEDLLTEEAKKICDDVNNYDSSLSCKICKKKIKKISYPNYFPLYASVDKTRFVTFHCKCALKKGTAKKFNKLVGRLENRFDYVYDVRG